MATLGVRKEGMEICMPYGESGIRLDFLLIQSNDKTNQEGSPGGENHRISNLLHFHYISGSVLIIPHAA